MSEPFVFRFSLDEAGRPQVMYVADVRCVCGLCKHPQMQRFYHATRFHPLTVERLVDLAARVHQKTDYACENCGEAVGPAQATQAALTYGCPDDAGIIRAFVEAPGEADGADRFELTARRRLDPQALPGFEPDDGRGRVYSELTEAVIAEAFGRVFNPKILWRELFADWRGDPAGGAFAKAAPGYWFALDDSPEAAAALGEDIRAKADRDDLEAIALGEATPHDLATHDDPERMPGRLHTWLEADDRRRLDVGKACALAYVCPDDATEAIERTFGLAELDYEVDGRGRKASFEAITTPGGERYGRPLSIGSVLRRAVYTGITPGEAGRLTAEEIAGMLLRVW